MRLQFLKRALGRCVFTLSAVVGIFVFSSNLPVALAETTVSQGRHGHLDETITLSGFSLEGPNGQQVTGTSTASSGVFTFTPDTALADGLYSATILPQDTVGNSTQYQVQLTVDSLPPAPPVFTGRSVSSGVIQARPAGNLSHKFDITLTGEREAESTVHVNDVVYVSPSSLQLWSARLFPQPGLNMLAVHLKDLAENTSEKVWVDLVVEKEFPIKIEYDGNGRIKRAYKP